MKIFTTATHGEGYFSLLKQTAADWGYELHVLGWGKPWDGFTMKIKLYVEALKKIPADEIVVCVDAYDVVVVGPPQEVRSKFLAMKRPVVFSGQRYFPGRSWIRTMADQLMSDSRTKFISDKINDPYDYSRPCMGVLAAYAGNLLELFEKLLEIEKLESIGNDQILLNKYYLQHPDAIHLDSTCDLFQNLWRTGRGLFGKVSPRHQQCEIEILANGQSERRRICNKKFKTSACFLHGPFNLDMGPVLSALGLDPPALNLKKSWHYWQYSIMYFVKRGARFFWLRLSLAALVSAGILYMIMLFMA